MHLQRAGVTIRLAMCWDVWNCLIFLALWFKFIFDSVRPYGVCRCLGVRIDRNRRNQVERLSAAKGQHILQQKCHSTSWGRISVSLGSKATYNVNVDVPHMSKIVPVGLVCGVSEVIY
jgi:hypothetical protein